MNTLSLSKSVGALTKEGAVPSSRVLPSSRILTHQNSRVLQTSRLGRATRISSIHITDQPISEKWRVDPRIAFFDDLDELLGRCVVMVYDKRTTSRKELTRQLKPFVRQVLQSDSMEDFTAKLVKHNSDPLVENIPLKTATGSGADPSQASANQQRFPIRLIFIEFDERTVQLVKLVNSRIQDRYVRKMPLIPVIVTIKSEIPAEQLQQCTDLGVVEILRKPISHDDLMRTVGLALRKFNCAHEAYKDISTEKAAQRYPKFFLKELNDNSVDAEGQETQEPSTRQHVMRQFSIEEEDVGDEEEDETSPSLITGRSVAHERKTIDVSQLFQNAWIKPVVDAQVAQAEALAGKSAARRAEDVLGTILQQGTFQSATKVTARILKDQAHRTNTLIMNRGTALVNTAVPLVDPRRRPQLYISNSKNDSDEEEHQHHSKKSHQSFHPDIKGLVKKEPPPASSPRTIGGIPTRKVEAVQKLMAAVQDMNTGAHRGLRDIDKLVLLSRDKRVLSTLKLSEGHSLKGNATANSDAHLHLARKFALRWKKKVQERKMHGLLRSQSPSKDRPTTPGYMRPTTASTPASRRSSVELAQRRSPGKPHESKFTMQQVVVSGLASKKLVQNMLELKVKTNDLLPEGLKVIEPQSHGGGASYFVISGFQKLLRKDIPGGLQLLNKAINKEPYNFTAYSIRGQLYGMKNEHFRACQDFTKAIELGKDRGLLPFALAGIYFNRSVCSINVGNDEVALADLYEAVKLDRKDLAYRRNLALALRRSGNFQSAQDEYISLWVRNERAKKEKTANERSKREVSLSCAGKGTSKRQSILMRKASSLSLIDEQSSIYEILKSHLEGSTTPDSLFDDDEGPEGKPGGNQKKKNDTPVESKLNHLMDYKTVMGGENFFDQIFCKPSEQQLALITPPQSRTVAHINSIEPVLQSLPLFRGLQDSITRHLCSLVEYRILNKTESCFNQGDPVAACCILLSGRITVKMQSDPEIAGGSVTMNVGELEAGDSFGESELILDKEKPRFLATYYVEEITEILLVLKEHFNTVLKNHVYERLKAKYQILKQSGIFTKWELGEVLRLASMAQVKHFHRNQIIEVQAQPPDCLYFLVRGLCRVTKYPDREAQIQRKIQDLNKELQRIKLKYTYHHSLRGKGIDQYVNEWGPKNNTNSELKKLELEEEIRTWEEQLKNLRKKESKHSKNVQASQTVATLIPPAFFGEMSVLDPAKGVALGTVVAETMVETLVVHKIVMQTFDITEDLLERIRRKAVKYPDDIDLAEMMERDEKWLTERNRIIDKMKLNKSKIDQIKPSQQIKHIKNILTLPDISRDMLIK